MGEKTTVVNSEQTRERQLTSDEIAFNTKQLEILDKQLSAIDKSNEFQQGVFTSIEPVLQDYGKLLQSQVADLNDPITQQIQQKAKELQSQQLDFAAETLPIQRELLQEQLDTIKRGGAATPEQQAAIDEYTQAALESGTTDINRFLDETVGRIRNELAPSRGLRPGDTPILDEADRAAAEAVRQRGQLQSGLQAANVTAKINLPLAIQQLTGAQSQSQQGINLATQQFANTLSSNAAANRLQVSQLLGGAIGGGTSGGLGLAGINPSGFIQSGNYTSRGTTTQTENDPLGGLGGILSGAGAALKGLGAVGLFGPVGAGLSAGTMAFNSGSPIY